MADIADLQKAIYNELSEIEQLIRLTNHPSLVKTPSVNASAGAGAVIEMPEEMEPNLKPYLLQPSGQNLQGLMGSINHKVESINRIAHTGAVRTTRATSDTSLKIFVDESISKSTLIQRAKVGLETKNKLVHRLRDEGKIKFMTYCCPPFRLSGFLYSRP